MGNRWITNSMSFVVGGMSPSTAIHAGIGIICVNVGILTHSYYLNRGKKKLDFVCQSTNICAAASILGAISVIITGVFNQNEVITATLYDLLYNGFFWVITAACDMYMFWERFMVVNKKCPKWKNYAIQAFIWMTILMWAPGYSLLPFFFDTNSVSFWDIYGQFYVVSGYLVLLYNLYFTVEFAFTLFKVVSHTSATTGGSSSAKTIKAIAIKSIIHCISSSVLNIVASYCLGVGSLLFLLFIPFGLHFLFNYKLERIGKQTSTIVPTVGYSTAPRRSIVLSAAPNSSHAIKVVNHTREQWVASSKCICPRSTLPSTGLARIDEN